MNQHLSLDAMRQGFLDNAKQTRTQQYIQNAKKMDDQMYKMIYNGMYEAFKDANKERHMFRDVNIFHCQNPNDPNASRMYPLP